MLRRVGRAEEGENLRGDMAVRTEWEMYEYEESYRGRYEGGTSNFGSD